jgi:hypothetical protein
VILLLQLSNRKLDVFLKRLRLVIGHSENSKISVFRFLSVIIPLLDQLMNLLTVDLTKGNGVASSSVRYSMSVFSWVIFYAKVTLRQFTTYIFPASTIRSEKKALEKFRISYNAPAKENDEEYLVSVVIPTYNRADLLVNRSIPSVLSQTHSNLEVVIVGDHCTDETEEKVGKIIDSRIRFYNLLVQGAYPEMKAWRWQVAGTKPMNVGIDLAKGDWICHLDDDDEFSPDHVELLLKEALRVRAELVYGIMQRETPTGDWEYVGSPNFGVGFNLRPAVLYTRYLTFFKWDINSWKLGEPGDGNIWKRMKLAGVKTAFLPKSVGKCYSSVRSIKKQ